jgi:NADPH-dependent 2,4-dienoyl-CoA reductase/sulfur reductase-like enzyme
MESIGSRKAKEMKISRRTAAKALLGGATSGLALPARARAADGLADDAAQERLRTEVCVIGGGSAGTGAALAAARAGAKVVLIECESPLRHSDKCFLVRDLQRNAAGPFRVKSFSIVSSSGER